MLMSLCDLHTPFITILPYNDEVWGIIRIHFAPEF